MTQVNAISPKKIVSDSSFMLRLYSRKTLEFAYSISFMRDIDSAQLRSGYGPSKTVKRFLESSSYRTT